MEYRILGNTGIRVSAVCFGVLTIRPLQANLNIQDGAEVVFLCPGKRYQFLTRRELRHLALHKRSIGHQQTIQTGHFEVLRLHLAGNEGECGKGPDEMGLAAVDIFMLHEQEDEKTLEGHRGPWSTWSRPSSRGQSEPWACRPTGFGLWLAADHPAIEVIHPLINQAGIGIMDGTPTTMAAAIQYARLRGKGLYAMKALGGGNLVNRAYQALHYVRSIPGLASVAIGMRSKDEVDLNIAWLKGVRDAELESRVSRTKRRLHIESWCTGCGSCAEVCRYQALSVQQGRTVVAQGRCVLCGYCAAYCPDFCIKIV